MSSKVDLNYDASSIKILEGLEAVRQRPGMYIGSTDRYGLHHLVYEIVDNSVDEALAGFCTKIIVTINEDNSCTVEDDGRGIPIGIHDKAGIPAVEVVLTTLHAGGKFEHQGYKVSGGLHGVGSSVVNALSEWLKVEVRREDKIYTNSYTRGIADNKIGTFIDDPQQKTTGTKVTFMPDDRIFETKDFSFEALCIRFRETAFLTKGLKIEFEDKRKGQEDKKSFCFEGGIIEYVKHIDASKESFFPEPIYINKEKDGVEIEIAMHYCKDYYDELVLSFANNIRTREGGTHLSGFRSALTRALNNYAKKNDLLNKKDGLFSGQDVREGLTAVISVKIADPQFEGQTKSKLGNSEVKGIVDSVIDENLSEYLEINSAVAKIIVNKCLASQRVRNAARNAQDLARRKSALESTTLPGKLADCSSTDPKECELYIVEGDSAGGSAKMGRDRHFQAILPLRGKILNVEKARLDKVLQSQELKNLITAIGPEAIENLSVRKDDEEEESDDNIKESLVQFARYHKIIIMTDADVDGSHIRTLLLTFFYRYAKSLIEEGLIYIAQPPLYLIKKGKSEVYCYNDTEKEQMVKKMGDNIKIQRYKGLGEMNPEQLWETTMNPENRVLLQIKMEDAEQAEEIFTMLMGTEVEPRKLFIQQQAKNARWIDI